MTSTYLTFQVERRVFIAFFGVHTFSERKDISPLSSSVLFSANFDGRFYSAFSCSRLMAADFGSLSLSKEKNNKDKEKKCCADDEMCWRCENEG